MQYQWRPGFRHAKLDPQPIGECIEALRIAEGGICLPEQLVEIARQAASPLHPLFEWDDTEAAIAYRREQAGDVLRHVAVVIESEPEREPIRAFVVVQRPDEKQGYTSIHAAMYDDEFRRQVLDRAKAELKTFRRKYAEYQELAAVLQAIDLVAV